ncbi:MAG TPA: RNase adapter RapZ, partial [Usitatibacter sp.]
GFKGGAPLDADFVFDARCVLPNPHYDPELRALTGTDPEVVEFLERETQANILVEDIQRFLQRWLPRFVLDQRASLTVAIGCTGGRHRSVYIASQLAERFAADYPVVLRHRDLKD